ADEVVQLDPAARKVVRRWPATREPHHLALSPDGRFLAAGSSRSGQVRCWDLRSGKPHWERTVVDGFNLRGMAFTPDGKAVVIAHCVRRDFPVSKHNIDQGWVIDNRLTKLSTDPDAAPGLWQIALDIHGKAVADPHGLAFST